MRPISNLYTTVKTATEASSAPAAAMSQPRSPWHSPVPYLFGGLAAMLGLIAFALLILACSYWRLSGRLDNNNNNERDAERDVEKDEGDFNKQVKVYEEKFLVIMAGEEKPTFLATPASTKANSSFDDKNGKVEENEGSEKHEYCEKAPKEEITATGDGDGHQQLPTITENSESN